MPVKILLFRLGHADHLGHHITTESQAILPQKFQAIRQIIQAQVFAGTGWDTGMDTETWRLILHQF